MLDSEKSYHSPVSFQPRCRRCRWGSAPLITTAVMKVKSFPFASSGMLPEHLDFRGWLRLSGGAAFCGAAVQGMLGRKDIFIQKLKALDERIVDWRNSLGG